MTSEHDVHADVERGEHHHDELDHRDVPVIDRVHQPLADAGEVEHVLDHHHPARQVEEVQADHLDRGGDRVRQRVHQDDPPFRDALQPGHLDIVGLQRLDHGGAHHPEDVRDDHDHQRRDRQDEQLRLAPRVGARRQQRDRRQQVRDHGGEQDDQGDRDDELGQRGHRQRGDRADVIEPAVLAQRGDGPQGHPEDRADHAGDQDEHRRVDEPGLDQPPHRLAVRERGAQPAGEQPGQPGPVLRHQALVQVQLALERVQPRRVRRPAQDGVGGVARQDLGGQEHHDRNRNRVRRRCPAGVR